MKTSEMMKIVSALDTAGLLKSHRDFTTVTMIVEQHEASTNPIWRTDLSDTWVAIKASQNRSPEGVGILTSPIMRTVAPFIGRVYVFDFKDTVGKCHGGRLCLPKDVPAGFDPEYGIRKAA